MRRWLVIAVLAISATIGAASHLSAEGPDPVWRTPFKVDARLHPLGDTQDNIFLEFRDYVQNVGASVVPDGQSGYVVRGKRDAAQVANAALWEALNHRTEETEQALARARDKVNSSRWLDDQDARIAFWRGTGKESPVLLRPAVAEQPRKRSLGLTLFAALAIGAFIAYATVAAMAAWERRGSSPR